MRPEQLIELAMPYVSWLLIVTAFSAVVCMVLMVQWVQGRPRHPGLAVLALALPVGFAVALPSISDEPSGYIAHSIGVRLIQPLGLALPLAVLAWGGAYLGLKGPTRNWRFGVLQLFAAWGAAGVIAVQGVLHDPLFGLVRAFVYAMFAVVASGGAFAGDLEKAENRAAVILGPLLFLLLVVTGEIGFTALADYAVAFNFPSVAPHDRSEVWRVYQDTVVNPQWRLSLVAVGVAMLGTLPAGWRVRSWPTEALVVLAGVLLAVAALFAPALSLDDCVNFVEQSK